MVAVACSGGESGGEAGSVADGVQSGGASTGGATSTSVKVNPPAVKPKDDKVILPSDLLFAFDSAELSSEAEQLLAPTLDLALGRPKSTIAVDGHTDSIGVAEYNLDLSRRRAANVASWLQARGVDAKRMTVRGLGAEQPVADNSTPEGQQMNRRVEITVSKT